MAMNEFQKRQRENTIATAIEAASRLQKKGVDLTFRAIAEEAELSHATLLQADVKNALYKRFQIGQCRKKDAQTTENMKKRIEELEKSLAKSRKVNSDLRKQVKYLQNECEKIKLQFQDLMFDYAVNIDKKIQPL